MVLQVIGWLAKGADVSRKFCQTLIVTKLVRVYSVLLELSTALLTFSRALSLSPSLPHSSPG